MHVSLTRSTTSRLAWRIALAACAVCVLWAAAAHFLVVEAARGRTYSDAAAVPPRHVGLVLGCSRLLADGRRNTFFDNRMLAAAQLFGAGKVDYLIVSGDNHSHDYDEPKDMKEALVRAGVPDSRVYCDYAGFRTLDSVIRVRAVFGQTSVVVVSQGFHNQRAIFIARHAGVDAIGLNAPEVDAYNSFMTRCREVLARANTLPDLFVFRRGPRFLGERVSLPA